MRTLVCRHCGRQVRSNKKLKHLTQHYCGNKACQSARKLSFDRHKYKTNGLFRSHKLQGVRDRKKTKKSDEGDPFFGAQYQSSYRESHPEYVLENKLRQKHRNAKRRRKMNDKPKIVNPDAFMQQRPDNDQVYAMIAVDYQKIVNPDALMMEHLHVMTVAKAGPMFVRVL